MACLVSCSWLLWQCQAWVSFHRVVLKSKNKWLVTPPTVEPPLASISCRQITFVVCGVCSPRVLMITFLFGSIQRTFQHHGCQPVGTKLLVGHQLYISTFNDVSVTLRSRVISGSGEQPIALAIIPCGILRGVRGTPLANYSIKYKPCSS